MAVWLLTGLFFLVTTLYMISDGDLSKIVVDSEVIHKFMAFVILGPIAIIPASIAIKAHTDDQ